MLNWDALVPGKRDNSADVLPLENGAGIMHTYAQTEQTSPAKSGTSPANPACRASLEANNGGASGATIPVIPASPAEKTREGKEIVKIDAGGGVAADNFAPEKARVKPAKSSFQPDTEAVAMVLAVAAQRGVDTQGLAVALESLRTMPSSEQIRHWHNVCQGIGIKPWTLLHPKSQEIGKDCMGCRHISSAMEFIPDLGRRCFTWLCGLGYPILIHGHGGERVLVAPPECESWEQWRMGGR